MSQFIFARKRIQTLSIALLSGALLTGCFSDDKDDETTAVKPDPVKVGQEVFRL